MGQSADCITGFGWNLGWGGEGYGDEAEATEWANDLYDRYFDDEEGDKEDVIFAEAMGIELPPNPWDELRGKPDGWFYLPREPRSYKQTRTPEYEEWTERTNPIYEARSEAIRLAREEAPFVFETHGYDEGTGLLLLAKASAMRVNQGQVGERSVVDLADSVPGWTNDLLRSAHSLSLSPPAPPAFLSACSFG